MFLALNPVIVGGRATWPKLAEVAAAAGFPGVEIPIVDAMKSTPDEVKAVLKANGVRPGAIGLPVDIRGDEATFERDLLGLDRASSFASAIGCPRMMTWILSSSELPKSEQRKVMLGRLRKVSNVLERSHVRLGLEFLGPLHIRTRYPNEFIWQMNEMLTFAKECGGNCGLMLDSWHWHHAGATPEDIVKAGRDAIVHVHLADAPDLPADKIRDNERLIPGEGIVNWKGFFGALKEIGYADATSPEVFGRGLKDMPLAEATSLVYRESLKLMRSLGVA